MNLKDVILSFLIIRIFAVFPALMALHSCKGAEEIKPNIILINIDDLGWTDLGCYGSDYYQTPNIDRLAAGGIRFTSAYAAAALCSPTRAAIMTGKYPARIGITDWIRAQFQGGGTVNQEGYEKSPQRNLLCPRNPFHMELEEVTIAEMLKQHGYTTCHIGKWHLGTDDYYPDRQGFDVNIAGCDYGQPPGYFDPYVNNKKSNTVYGFPTMESRREGEYLTDREADEAVSFIEVNQDGPFFLNLCHYAVHGPHQAKKEKIEKYNGKAGKYQDNPVYAAMVESVDESVARIMQLLEDLELTENTMIIFTSDNGGVAGITSNEPLRLGKTYPYEGGIRVPTIVYWPGVIKRGSSSYVPVISMDFFPTICEVAGIPVPDTLPIDGVSLMPLIRDPAASLAREDLFWHYPHYRGEKAPYSIIRSGDWKLIRYYEGHPFELYNLKEDLSEKNDLAESAPEKVKVLNSKLQAWLEEVDAKLPK